MNFKSVKNLQEGDIIIKNDVFRYLVTELTNITTNRIEVVMESLDESDHGNRVSNIFKKTAKLVVESTFCLQERLEEIKNHLNERAPRAPMNQELNEYTAQFWNQPSTELTSTRTGRKIKVGPGTRIRRDKHGNVTGVKAKYGGWDPVEAPLAGGPEDPPEPTGNVVSSMVGDAGSSSVLSKAPTPIFDWDKMTRKMTLPWLLGGTKTTGTDVVYDRGHQQAWHPPETEAEKTRKTMTAYGPIDTSKHRTTSPEEREAAMAALDKVKPPTIMNVDGTVMRQPPAPTPSTRPRPSRPGTQPSPHRPAPTPAATAPAPTPAATAPTPKPSQRLPLHVGTEAQVSAGIIPVPPGQDATITSSGKVKSTPVTKMDSLANQAALVNLWRGGSRTRHSDEPSSVSGTAPAPTTAATAPTPKPSQRQMNSAGQFVNSRGIPIHSKTGETGQEIMDRIDKKRAAQTPEERAAARRDAIASSPSIQAGVDKQTAGKSQAYNDYIRGKTTSTEVLAGIAHANRPVDDSVVRAAWEASPKVTDDQKREYREKKRDDPVRPLANRLNRRAGPVATTPSLRNQARATRVAKEFMANLPVGKRSQADWEAKTMGMTRPDAADPDAGYTDAENTEWKKTIRKEKYTDDGKAALQAKRDEISAAKADEVINHIKLQTRRDKAKAAEQATKSDELNQARSRYRSRSNGGGPSHSSRYDESVDLDKNFLKEINDHRVRLQRVNTSDSSKIDALAQRRLDKGLPLRPGIDIPLPSAKRGSEEHKRRIGAALKNVANTQDEPTSAWNPSILAPAIGKEAKAQLWDPIASGDPVAIGMTALTLAPVFGAPARIVQSGSRFAKGTRRFDTGLDTSRNVKRISSNGYAPKGTSSVRPSTRPRPSRPGTQPSPHRPTPTPQPAPVPRPTPTPQPAPVPRPIPYIPYFPLQDPSPDPTPDPVGPDTKLEPRVTPRQDTSTDTSTDITPVPLPRLDRVKPQTPRPPATDRKDPAPKEDEDIDHSEKADDPLGYKAGERYYYNQLKNRVQQVALQQTARTEKRKTKDTDKLKIGHYDTAVGPTLGGEAY